MNLYIFVEGLVIKKNEIIIIMLFIGYIIVKEFNFIIENIFF